MRPCLGLPGKPCGAPTSSTRCPSCSYLNEKGRRPNFRARGYDAEYQRNRALLLSTNPGCYRCGAPATTADHITPRSQGGGNGMGNLRPACLHCNSARGGRTDP